MFNTAKTVKHAGRVVGLVVLVLAMIVTTQVFLEVKTNWFVDWPYFAEMLTGVGTLLLGFGAVFSFLIQWGYADVARENERLSGELVDKNARLKKRESELLTKSDELHDKHYKLIRANNRLNEKKKQLEQANRELAETNAKLERTYKELKSSNENLQQAHEALMDSETELQRFAKSARIAFATALDDLYTGNLVYPGDEDAIIKLLSENLHGFDPGVIRTVLKDAWDRGELYNL